MKMCCLTIYSLRNRHSLAGWFSQCTCILRLSCGVVWNDRFQHSQLTATYSSVLFSEANVFFFCLLLLWYMFRSAPRDSCFHSHGLSATPSPQLSCFPTSLTMAFSEITHLHFISMLPYMEKMAVCPVLFNREMFWLGVLTTDSILAGCNWLVHTYGQARAASPSLRMLPYFLFQPGGAISRATWFLGTITSLVIEE